MSKHQIKLFYPTILFSSNTNSRGEIFELLKSKIRLEEKFRNVDFAIQDRIEWVVDESMADYVILPMSWNHYHKNNQISDVLTYCQNLNDRKIKVLSFTSGDFGISPNVSNLTVIYRFSGYASTWQSNFRLLPYMLSDPIERFFHSDTGTVLKKVSLEKPIIGFTGMAPKSKYVFVKEILQTIYRNTLSFLKKSPYDAQDIQSASYKRNMILMKLEKDSRFLVDFIKREKYRAGAKSTTQRRIVAEEYYQNQLNSQFIVCVRGLGNFSARFYETLAMGRVPIFIDTDSVLPDIDDLFWDNFIIKVDYSNLNDINNTINDWFLVNFKKNQFELNRKFWEEKLSLQGFWVSEINRLISR